ncbi:MAG: PASTA domain-containing protein [Oscillospiraceae bacterium]|nr:PASTA domain-containing protein [Oscillospiraceae bacterium]
MGERRLCCGCMEYKPGDAAVCPNCGYADGTAYDANYIIPGTELNERYIVGVKLRSNSEGATYIGYNKSIGCKVLIREYMPEGLCTRLKGMSVICVNSQQVVQYKALMAEFTELNKSLAHMRNVSHITPTLDLFSSNNTTYAVYEYIDGVTLVDYLKDNAGELTWSQVKEMFPTFFTTLSLLHNNGIVHRAISPDTIYVTSKNELRLTGFSISTVRTMHTELPCEIFDGYAAPEQYNANTRQGTWTDVYGICAVLYRILTGCKPTEATSRMQNDNLCAPHEMNPNIPKHVSKVIMRGMSLFSEDRIKTVTELVTALFEEDEEPEPTPIPIEPSRRQQSRRQNVTDYETYRRNALREERQGDDYVSEDKENVIDRIKIPIIIGVLLTCVLLVIAIVVLNLLDIDMDPKESMVMETSAPTIAATTDNIVLESASDEVQPSGDSQMPDLIGKNFESKKEQLEKDGWLYLLAKYDYSEKYKAGLIIDQQLKPGTPFSSGATVEVTVSKGPSSITIPEFEGKTLKEYTAMLDDLGLPYNTEKETDYDFENGMVTRLSQDAGEKFDLTKGGETLKVFYADNPEVKPAPQPDYSTPSLPDSSEAVDVPGVSTEDPAVIPPESTNDEPVEVLPDNPPMPEI